MDTEAQWSFLDCEHMKCWEVVCPDSTGRGHGSYMFKTFALCVSCPIIIHILYKKTVSVSIELL